eukprot:TRINITY_DN13762_c0_g1_i1.p2 TRINITY_DN13762_c0_g1~~TRINITY_DN13762_c0_g1_i1.p2  ORF type:complete len:152 (-),score=46.89 TRINITY_DN13762_c0_g1_i1:82-537(-)
MPSLVGSEMCIRDSSGTGVCFTRNPSTGENKFYGEFLMNAQGEDVVAGIRTPGKIEELERVMPLAYKQLLDIRKLLENHYKDMQDIEFTIEKSKLYILQTRNGKRTGPAAVRMAVEMVEDCLLYTSDAADDMQCVDLGGRRIIKKKKKLEL